MDPESTVRQTPDVAVQDYSRHYRLLAESVKDEMSNLEFVEKRKLPNRESVYIHIPRRFRHLAVYHSLHFYGYFEYEHDRRHKQLVIPMTKILNQIGVEKLHQLKMESNPSTVPTKRRRRFPSDDVAAMEEEVKEEDRLFEFPLREDVAESDEPSSSIDPPSSSTLSLSPSSRKRKMDDDSSLSPSSKQRKMDGDSSSSSSSKKPCFDTVPVPDDIPPRPDKSFGFYPDM